MKASFLRGLAGLRPSLIDRYLLRQMAGPMAAALGVMMVALSLYRVLDMVRDLSGSGAALWLIPVMLADVAPQYLGIAVPAAYFIAMFMLIARLSNSSELDALFAGGVSVDRLIAPLMAVGLAVAVVEVVLLGFVQPVGFYQFQVDLDRARHSGWDAQLQPRAFVSLGDGVVLSAEHVDLAGRGLRGVYLRRTTEDGMEQVFTAKRGSLSPSPDGDMLSLTLTDGQQFQERAEGPPVVGAFAEFTVDGKVPGWTPSFRPRGAGPRELTLAELPQAMRDKPDPAARRAAAAEFYARLVRIISTPLLPLLAASYGMAGKRQRRTGAIASGVILSLYENGIDFGQSLASSGMLPAVAAVWAPFAILAAGCIWLFSKSRLRPGATLFAAASR